MSTKISKNQPKTTAIKAASKTPVRSSVSGSIKNCAPKGAAKPGAKNGTISASDALTMRAWKKTYANRDKRVD